MSLRNSQGDDEQGSIVSHPSDETPAPTIIGDHEGPDLIVLGFQELDLSTGALLYSTETTREEAWYTAVLAGLGEKAAEYDKVISPRPPAICPACS